MKSKALKPCLDCEQPATIAGRCVRCYWRKRRGTKAKLGEVLRSHDGERMTSFTVELPEIVAKIVQRSANLNGVSTSRFLRRVISDAAARGVLRG